MDDLLRLRWDRPLAEIMLQQARMADEGGVEGGSGDIKAGKAIEKAKAKDIGPEKSPERTEGSFRRQPTGPFL
jgi:hypothetical protein